MISIKFTKTLLFIILIQYSFLFFQDTLFKKVVESYEGENFMISPFSIYQVLSLLSNGALEATKDEILKVLYPDKRINDELLNKINNNIKQIISNIESENIRDSSSLNISLFKRRRK